MSLIYGTSTILFALKVLPFQHGLLLWSSSHKSRYGHCADNICENVSGYGLGLTALFFPKLPNGIILCPMDIVGLYPNISHEEGLSALRKRPETRKEKYLLTGTIIDSAEVVLKNNIFVCQKKPPYLL